MSYSQCARWTTSATSCLTCEQQLTAPLHHTVSACFQWGFVPSNVSHARVMSSSWLVSNEPTKSNCVPASMRYLAHLYPHLYAVVRSASSLLSFQMKAVQYVNWLSAFVTSTHPHVRLGWLPCPGLAASPSNDSCVTAVCDPEANRREAH